MRNNGQSLVCIRKIEEKLGDPALALSGPRAIGRGETQFLRGNYGNETKSSRMIPGFDPKRSALPGNIYLHKLDQEIRRIRQKYEIPIVQKIRSVLLRTGRIDDQENSGEEATCAFGMGHGRLRVEKRKGKVFLIALPFTLQNPKTSNTNITHTLETVPTLLYQPKPRSRGKASLTIPIMASAPKYIPSTFPW
ncbi:hypothetical protein GOBAR_AA40020 [Gossypium barbadense]|uniref:Uncharacterized protein n=1 Tax=Gossypium barbadense TaxID=3634 RepID=A0A2P5VPB4_GOSBA|nr:hypothetical protein GOBAR_AA40020 [Gossypium barbadense]